MTAGAAPSVSGKPTGWSEDDPTPEPTAVRFDDDRFWVDLADHRTIGVPLVWFPRLLHATPAQREAWTLSPSGVHWEEIDEDISVAGLLAGRGDQTIFPKSKAA